MPKTRSKRMLAEESKDHEATSSPASRRVAQEANSIQISDVPKDSSLEIIDSPGPGQRSRLELTRSPADSSLLRAPEQQMFYDLGSSQLQPDNLLRTLVEKVGRIEDLLQSLVSTNRLRYNHEPGGFQSEAAFTKALDDFNKGPPDGLVQASEVQVTASPGSFQFQKFKDSELETLPNKSLKLYKNMMRIARKEEPVAYFLFENRHLSERVMKAHAQAYGLFVETGRTFSPENVRSFLIEKDISSSYWASTLKGYYKHLIAIGVQAFGFDRSCFKTIKFSSDKQSKEAGHSALPREMYIDAWRTLKEKGMDEDALLIQLMWCLASRPNEMLTLRFEDFSEKGGIWKISYYANKKRKSVDITIDEELYNEVMLHKRRKVREGSYRKSTVTTPTKKVLEGHFVFDLTKDQLGQRFRRKYKKLIPNFVSRAKDIRMSSLTDAHQREGLVRASSLAMHSNTGMTSKNYIRGARNLK